MVALFGALIAGLGTITALSQIPRSAGELECEDEFVGYMHGDLAITEPPETDTAEDPLAAIARFSRGTPERPTASTWAQLVPEAAREVVARRTESLRAHEFFDENGDGPFGYIELRLVGKKWYAESAAACALNVAPSVREAHENSR